MELKEAKEIQARICKLQGEYAKKGIEKPRLLAMQQLREMGIDVNESQSEIAKIRTSKKPSGIGNYHVIMMDVDSIKLAPFNPPGRVTPHQLARLKNSIEKAGKIIVPLVVSSDGYLADGHRRLACAKLLGYDMVPVIISHSPLSDLWSECNCATKSITGKDWLYASTHGMESDVTMPKNVTRQIEALQSLLTPDELSDISTRRSPGIISTVREVSVYVNDDTHEFQRKLLLWLDKFGQDIVRAAIKYAEVDPEVIRLVIEQDRPLRRSWKIG